MSEDGCPTDTESDVQVVVDSSVSEGGDFHGNEVSEDALVSIDVDSDSIIENEHVDSVPEDVVGTSSNHGLGNIACLSCLLTFR